jgi:integrase
MLRATRHLRIDGRHLSKFILAGLYTGTRRTATLGLAIDHPALHHGWVDTEQGMLYRAGREARRTKKRQPTARLPRQFLAHVRRWKAKGCRWVVESYEGNRIGDIKKGWANMIQIAEDLAAKAESPIDLSGVTPHSLRHTAITWAMQRGADKWDACGFFGVSMDTLEGVYAHHHPDHQKSAVEAMERKTR